MPIIPGWGKELLFPTAVLKVLWEGWDLPLKILRDKQQECKKKIKPIKCLVPQTRSSLQTTSPCRLRDGISFVAVFVDSFGLSTIKRVYFIIILCSPACVCADGNQCLAVRARFCHSLVQNSSTQSQEVNSVSASASHQESLRHIAHVCALWLLGARNTVLKTVINHFSVISFSMLLWHQWVWLFIMSYL